jgi:type IV secretory pathway VirB2 component (pilin)
MNTKQEKLGLNVQPLGKTVYTALTQLTRPEALKKSTTLVLMGLTLVQGVFAQASGDSFGISSRIEIILNLLSSPWVRGVCAIALIVECIGMITAGRQEPGMFKKFIPWIAGTVLFMAAGTITKMFIDPSGAEFGKVLEAS